MTSTTGPGQPPRFFRDFVRIAGPYWTGRGRWRPCLLAAAFALLIVTQVALAIRLNLWSADLFDALERRSTDRAVTQIAIFALIMLGTMVTNAAHLLVRRQLQLDWRRWLTARVIGDWMEDARHYQAGLIPGDHANPDHGWGRSPDYSLAPVLIRAPSRVVLGFAHPTLSSYTTGRDTTRRLKQLEYENARLKKLVAERDLEIVVMKEIAAKKMVSVPARREQVTYATRQGVSQRRACTLMKESRSTLGYRSRLAVKSAPVLAGMAALSGQYPRYGCRRIRIFLARDSHTMSAGRAYRLWRRAGLQLP